MTQPGLEYSGSELEIFQHAGTWKTYFSSFLAGFIGANVLEVGAGIGGTTKYMCAGQHDSWICLEPDENLYRHLVTEISEGNLPACCEPRQGTLADIPAAEKFDTILYVDVLEHIEDDRSEIERAAEKLVAGGRLIVLVPAHQWLFSPFDSAIGHYRRYNARSLQSLTPATLSPVRSRYLDACGIMLSLANRTIMRRSAPTQSNIDFWDRVVVPASRLVDPLLFYRVGKTVIQVWQKVDV